MNVDMDMGEDVAVDMDMGVDVDVDVKVDVNVDVNIDVGGLPCDDRLVLAGTAHVQIGTGGHLDHMGRYRSRRGMLFVI